MVGAGGGLLEPLRRPVMPRLRGTIVLSAVLTGLIAIYSSFGAIDRSDDMRGRFASIELRVGDYTLDNTHPIRGDAGGVSPRGSRRR